MAERGRVGRDRRGHPGGPRRRRATSARSPRATGSASSAATASWRSAARSADAAIGAARRSSSTTSREIVTVIDGRGRRPPAHTDAITDVARRAPSRRRGRGPPRRPAAVPVPLRRRVSDRRVADRSRCASSTAIGVERLKGVGEREARGARTRSASTSCSTCSPLPAPLGRPHATRPSISDLVPGRGGARAGRRCAACPSASTPQPPDDGRASMVGDGSGLPARRVLQPAVAGAAAARGHRGRAVRQGSTCTAASGR